MFLDEPTSGLDSRQALQVMRAVSNVAKQGRTVICTVHREYRAPWLLTQWRSGFPLSPMTQLARTHHHFFQLYPHSTLYSAEPSAEIFSLFTDLVLLARGGYTVYLGPLGHRGRDLVKHLSGVPGVPPYQPGECS